MAGQGAETEESGDRPDGEHRVWALTAVLAALALTLQLTLFAAQSAPSRPFTIPWWGLLLAFLAAELVVVNLTFGRETHSFSLGEIPLIAGLAFAGPNVLVLTNILGFAIALVRQRQSPLKLAFNLAATWLHTVLAVIVWRAVLGPADPSGPRAWLAILAVTLLIDLASAASVTAAISLLEGRLELSALREGLVGGTVEAIANGCFAIVVITVLDADWRAAWALIAVAAVLSGAYRSYLSLQRRHDSLEQLAGFTRAMDGELRARAIAERVAEQVRELLQVEVVELVDHAGEDALRVRSGRDDGGGTGLAALLAAAAPVPLLAPRGTRDARLRAALAAAGLRDAIIAPLGESGTLLAADRLGDVDTFDAHDLAVLASLANNTPWWRSATGGWRTACATRPPSASTRPCTTPSPA